MVFACLEVVLDRGQTEDWFESNFIIFFFTVAMIALVFAIVWEWRIPIQWWKFACWPTEILLWQHFYFIFGFTLYGSTVLIPQMLQRLFGYTATDAGLVLGPGAFVNRDAGAGGGKILPKIGVKWLIGFGYFRFRAGHVVLRGFTLATAIVTKRGRERCKGWDRHHYLCR